MINLISYFRQEFMGEFLIAIILAGLFELTKELWKLGRKKRQVRNDKKRWAEFDECWTRLKILIGQFEIVQRGWRDGIFLEEEVVMFTGNNFILNKLISSEIFVKNVKDWEESRIQNLDQIGVRGINIQRISEDPFKSSQRLTILGHIYKFYDYLSTNAIYFSGDPSDKNLLISAFEESQNPSYDKPISCFANPLSVGLTMFCENGDCLVITKRSTNKLNGGHHEAGKKYNSVGENMNCNDVYQDDFSFSPRLSPWATAKRGLNEEMGIIYDSKSMSIYLNSFIWDRRVLDYKFFGYTINKYSRFEVEKIWQENPHPDKHEASKLYFYDIKNKKDAEKILKEIVEHKEEWALESIFCTIYSLIHTKKIDFDNLLKILND